MTAPTRRVLNRLTDAIVRNAEPGDRAYKLFDGQGLFLLVKPNGARYWRLKYRFQGKERLAGLGTFSDVSIQLARARRAEIRQLLLEGKDPIKVRRELRNFGSQELVHAAQSSSLSPSGDEVDKFAVAATSDDRYITDGNQLWTRVQTEVQQRLPTGRVVTAIRQFRRNVEPMLSRGEIHSLLESIRALPEDTLRHGRDLVWYKTWLLYLSGRTTEALNFQKYEEGHDLTSDPVRQEMALVFQAYVALNWGDPRDARSLAQKAVNQFGSSPTFFRIYSLTLLGQAHSQSGDRIAAIDAHTMAFHLSQGSGNHLMMLDSICHLVQLLRAQGKLREALGMCRRAIEEHVDERGAPLPISGMVHVPLGLLLYETNDLENAHRHLCIGVGLAQKLGMIYLVILGKQWLARLQHALGQWEAAWTTLAAAREISERPQSPRRQRLVGVATAELQVREGNLLAAKATLRELERLPGKTPEDEALLHVRLLLSQGRPKQAFAILAPIEKDAHRQKMEGSLVEVYVLQAISHELSGNRSVAVSRLTLAVSLASTAGYLRVFIEHGPILERLLELVRQVAPSFVNTLLESLATQKQMSSVPGVLFQSLTKAELSIVSRLTDGLTNQEIAKQLRVAVPTVKWHLSNIFGKLQARNRIEAIAQARRLKLVR